MSKKPAIPGLGLKMPALNLNFSPGERTPREEQEARLEKCDVLCSKITDVLFLGSQTVSKNKKLLDKNGITHILNCAGAICPVYYPSDYTYKTLYLLDDVREDMSLLIYDIIEWVDAAVQNNGKVFIHCQQGVSRSSAMMIGYLMWKNNWEYERTQLHVKAIRDVSSPNGGFIAQLLNLRKRLTQTQFTAPRLHQVVAHSTQTPNYLVGKKGIKKDFDVKSDKMNSTAWIVHTGEAEYMWFGKEVSKEKEAATKEIVLKIQKFEPSAPKKIVEVRQGGETPEFLKALDSVE